MRGIHFGEYSKSSGLGSSSFLLYTLSGDFAFKLCKVPLYIITIFV